MKYPQPKYGASGAFNQSLSFNTSKVTNMNRMFLVCSSPRPAPNLQPGTLPYTLLAAAVVRRLLPPDPYTSPPHALLSTLGRTLRRSTSR